MATFVGLGIVNRRTELLADETGALVVTERGHGILVADTHNDLDVTADGNLRLVTDAEAVGQHARQRLQFYQGEWFLDPEVGVDWFGRVLGLSETRAPVAEAEVKRVLLRTPGVTGLREVSMQFDRANRGVRLDRIEVETQFDEVTSL